MPKQHSKTEDSMVGVREQDIKKLTAAAAGLDLTVAQKRALDTDINSLKSISASITQAVVYQEYDSKNGKPNSERNVAERAFHDLKTKVENVVTTLKAQQHFKTVGSLKTNAGYDDAAFKAQQYLLRETVASFNSVSAKTKDPDVHHILDEIRVRMHQGSRSEVQYACEKLENYASTPQLRDGFANLEKIALGFMDQKNDMTARITKLSDIEAIPKNHMQADKNFSIAQLDNQIQSLEKYAGSKKDSKEALIKNLVNTLKDMRDLITNPDSKVSDIDSKFSAQTIKNLTAEFDSAAKATGGFLKTTKQIENAVSGTMHLLARVADDTRKDMDFKQSVAARQEPAEFKEWNKDVAKSYSYTPS